MSPGAVYEIVPASVLHVRPLSASLRPAACMTLQAFGLDTRAALRRAFAGSAYCRTALIDGVPAAMWGLSGSLLTDTATVWLALGQRAAAVPVAVMRGAISELEEMLRGRSTLFARISREDDAALIFARSIGFTPAREIEAPEGIVVLAYRGRHLAVAKPRRREESRPPFIIHALGRSRTAWLASFLSYGRWECLHEQAIHLREIADVERFFSRPRTGYSETAASFGWPLILHARPDTCQVVVRRDPAEAAEAMAAQYQKNGLDYDAAAMASVFKRGSAVLDRIGDLPGVLSVPYEELQTEDGCRAIFEKCLPYKWDREWWLQLRDAKIETDVPRMVRYYQENRPAIENFKRLCRRELLRLAHTGELRHAIN